MYYTFMKLVEGEERWEVSDLPPVVLPQNRVEKEQNCSVTWSCFIYCMDRIRFSVNRTIAYSNDVGVIIYLVESLPELCPSSDLKLTLISPAKISGNL
ncbi:hypothetical protein TNCV_2993241 [Trichonephila clavipes]|nr:hypothetical protein TNCV_2993241 [Trichonephila clavipes]